MEATLMRTRPIVFSVCGKTHRWLHLVMWNSSDPMRGWRVGEVAEKP